MGRNIKRAWSYKILIEFVFKDGMLADTIDHSKVAEELRCQIKEDPDFEKKLRSDVSAFIENSFDLSMATKAWWIK